MAWITDANLPVIAIWTAIVLSGLATGTLLSRWRDPGQLYRDLTRDLGDPVADRIEGAASPEQKKRLAELSPQEIRITEIGGEKIDCVLDKAPGNGAPIGGIKVITASGWFAARPSGTEDIYKIYGESFRGEDHLRILLGEAQQVVDRALAGG